MTALLKPQCDRARTRPCLIYRAVLMRYILAVSTFYFWQNMNYLVFSEEILVFCNVSKYGNGFASPFRLGQHFIDQNIGFSWKLESLIVCFMQIFVCTKLNTVSDVCNLKHVTCPFSVNTIRSKSSHTNIYCVRKTVESTGNTKITFWDATNISDSTGFFLSSKKNVQLK